MRALLVILILVVAGYLAYTYLYVPATDEEKALADLEKRFGEATRALVGAERMAGSTGLDTTSDADQAIQRVRRIDNQLRNLKARLKDDTLMDKVKALEAKIREFYRKNGLD